MTEADYQKALAWIARESPKRPRSVEAAAGWRVVNLVAALFDKSPRIVASDVVQFARAIEGGRWRS
jgi:hypothetical protein